MREVLALIVAHSAPGTRLALDELDREEFAAFSGLELDGLAKRSGPYVVATLAGRRRLAELEALPSVEPEPVKQAEAPAAEEPSTVEGPPTAEDAFAKAIAKLLANIQDLRDTSFVDRQEAANKVRAARVQAGLSQRAFARRLGVTQNQVWRVERCRAADAATKRLLSLVSEVT